MPRGESGQAPPPAVWPSARAAPATPAVRRAADMMATPRRSLQKRFIHSRFRSPPSLSTYRSTAASQSHGAVARHRARLAGTPATASGSPQSGSGASEARHAIPAKAAHRNAYSFA
eukprot:scaffold10891_cov141-Isochrysis_galbana.AAC.2